MIIRQLVIVLIAIGASALVGCDTIHYTLKGHVTNNERGNAASAPNATLRVQCPSKMLTAEETKADEKGNYTITGKGSLVGCTLFAEYSGLKKSTTISRQDIIDESLPLSPVFKKDVYIGK